MDIFSKRSVNENKSPVNGFSLIEVLVALFVFSVLITAISGVYVAFLGAQKKAKETQRTLEGAQLTLNSLAKSLRTSKVIVPVGSGTTKTIRIYDYSGTSSGITCMEYSVTDEKKLEFRGNGLSESECTDSADLGTSISLINRKVYGGFIVKENSSAQAGMITVSLQLCPAESEDSVCTDTVGSPIRIQTSVSLRVGG